MDTFGSSAQPPDVCHHIHWDLNKGGLCFGHYSRAPETRNVSLPHFSQGQGSCFIIQIGTLPSDFLVPWVFHAVPGKDWKQLSTLPICSDKDSRVSPCKHSLPTCLPFPTPDPVSASCSPRCLSNHYVAKDGLGLLMLLLLPPKFWVTPQVSTATPSLSGAIFSHFPSNRPSTRSKVLTR